MNKELTTKQAKEFSDSLEKKRNFSEGQILSAKNEIEKWLGYIINDSGWGKIEIFINATEHIIDVKPTINKRYFKEKTQP